MDEDPNWNTKTEGSGKHKCKICKKKFTEKASLNQHVQLHSSDKPYTCHICSYAGKTQKYLSRHVKLAHSAASAHECSYCGRKFHYLSKLNEHLPVHTNTRPYKCKVCGKGFNSYYSLGNHSNIHKDVKPYKCLFCEYACRDSSTLRKHHARHTGLTKIYQCATCYKSYKKKSELRVHVSEVHLNIDLKTKPCHTCGKMFKSTSHLTAHVQRVHERIHAAQCEICGAKVSSRYNMDTHLRSHLDLRPFLCGFAGCDKRYKDKSTLKKHTLVHYPEKQLACELCDKRFTRVGRYRSHLRQHMPRDKCVECDYCGVRFYSKNYLRTHIMRKHVARRSYVCDECGFCAHNKPGLVRHIRMGHDAELDRQCKICHKVYKKHAYLKSHYWNTHYVRYKTTSRSKKPSQEQDKIVIKEEPMEEVDTSIENLLNVDVEKHEIITGSEADRQAVDELMLNVVTATSDNLETLFMDLLQPQQQDDNEPPLLYDSTCEEEAQKRIKHLLKEAKRRQERRNKSLGKSQENLCGDTKPDKDIETITSKVLSVSSEQNIEVTYYDENDERKENTNSKVNQKSPNNLIHQKVEKIEINIESKMNDIEKCIQKSLIEGSDPENNVDHDTPCTMTNDSTYEQSQEQDIKNELIDETTNKIIITKGKNKDTLHKVTKQKDTRNITSTKKKKENGITQRKSKVIRNRVQKIKINTKTRNKGIKNLEKLFTRSKLGSKNIGIQHSTLQNTAVEMNKELEVEIGVKAQTADENIRNNTDKSDNEASNQDSISERSQDKQVTISQEVLSVNNKFIDEAEDLLVQNNNETSGSKQTKGIIFNSHQCYECFKLFETKEKLLDHCKIHYSLCNDTILKKCPLCDFVTTGNLARHIHLMHDVNIKIGMPGLKENENDVGPRYFYNVDNEIVNKIDVIPSIKNLNKRAYIKLDKMKRLATNKAVQKTKLVKRDGEWIVEKRNINIKADDIVIPNLEKIEGDYFVKLKKLATVAKNSGKRFLYPCNKCEKICQTMAALKLHYRNHDPDKKPFKPKVWKHKMNGAQKALEPKVDKVPDSSNRYEKPKPIVNKHKCDPKLMHFYENNIKGGDIEFWQFLKIYNKMTRDNVNDFKDLENMTEFGNHIPTAKGDENITNTERTADTSLKSNASPSCSLKSNSNSSCDLVKNAPKISTTVEISRLTNKNLGFKRVVRINRKEYVRRNKIKQMMRDRIRNNKGDS